MDKGSLLSFVVLMALITGCGKAEKTDHQGHEEHAQVAQRSSDENHAGHGHGVGEVNSDEHFDERVDEHGDEDEIVLTPEAYRLAQITLAMAGKGSISEQIELSGEVGFNEDRLVHITPRYAGIVKEVKYRTGEYVKAGEVVAVIESNQSMTNYSLKAPISGSIIEKHISVGEYASEQESVYLLADLSNVWVNLAVYPKDASKVRYGQKVTITAVGSGVSVEGSIGYVTPVMDPQTRRVIARVVLSNRNNMWRPGSFVHASINTGGGEDGIVVDKEAVQVLGVKNVVFIQHEPNAFKPVEVITGESDKQKIRILSGLQPGAEYVNKGAFDLKAKIVTGSLGEHAGHGH